jgi:hypothetical protein
MEAAGMKMPAQEQRIDFESVANAPFAGQPAAKPEKEGDEEIEAAGRKWKCHWLEMKVGDASSKVWTCDRVPLLGGMVKSETRCKVGDQETMTKMELTGTSAFETLTAESFPVVCVAIEDAIGAGQAGKARLDDIRNQWKALLAAAPTSKQTAVARFRERVAKAIEEAGVTTPSTPESLDREIVVLSDRLDFSEELARLESHLQQMTGTLSAGGEVGKKLDFLTQELFREINTIGSKSGDAVMTRNVIEFKSLLETVREMEGVVRRDRARVTDRTGCRRAVRLRGGTRTPPARRRHDPGHHAGIGAGARRIVPLYRNKFPLAAYILVETEAGSRTPAFA